MRLWFGGPRVFGIRPGISFGREDLRWLSRPNKTEPSTRPAGSFLYVIKDERGRSKIGTSANPGQRLRELQTGSAERLALAYIGAPDCGTPEAVRIERSAHDLLDHHRSVGEWFDVPPGIAVSAIAGTAYALNVRLAEIGADKIDEAARLLSLSAQRSSGMTGSQRQGVTLAIWFATLLLLFCLFFAR